MRFQQGQAGCTGRGRTSCGSGGAAFGDTRVGTGSVVRVQMRNSGGGCLHSRLPPALGRPRDGAHCLHSVWVGLGRGTQGLSTLHGPALWAGPHPGGGSCVRSGLAWSAVLLPGTWGRVSGHFWVSPWGPVWPRHVVGGGQGCCPTSLVPRMGRPGELPCRCTAGARGLLGLLSSWGAPGPLETEPAGARTPGVSSGSACSAAARRTRRVRFSGPRSGTGRLCP